ncbi:TnsD family Tn7-like transposition protein [Paenibacillus donghaensis]|uniref:Transposon Tn7 transposition protein TnsD C-termianl domain-containing protein n=1 Tax=Paenibacillus donghaensis TaxID=414771 RepID=A0A2Z2KLJ9_9BACL|nr:TnsD family Tn7-like transposition protein [Paenibacillus donghaensis]ASA24273.1 hypothetical protein B9T62_28035 [Paenibacillus donghaensis]
MIYFPPPFPDELLYSVLARYHARSGNENTKFTMRDLFGKKTVCAVTDFPGHLNDLHSLIPGNAIPLSVLINGHTLLPYYRPYITPEQYDNVTRDMIFGDGQSIYMKMGLAANKVKQLSYLRYCSACIEEDRSKYGAAYWHRYHQITGFNICSVHNCYLHNSKVSYAQRRNKHEFVMLESVLDSNSHQLEYSENALELLIAQQSEALLKMNYQAINEVAIRKVYYGRLSQMGLLTAKGHVRFQDLLPKFESFFGAIYLKEQRCSIDKNSQHTWLHKMLRKPRHGVHPLRHILLQLYLGIEVKEILEKKYVSAVLPFGEGPWPCLNKGSEHFGGFTIPTVNITRDYESGNSVGTFSCNCGFVYSRRGPDKKNEDLYRIGRIKNFGPTWIEKLIELNDNKDLGLRERARQLGVDAGTVKRQTNLLKLGAKGKAQQDSKPHKVYSFKVHSNKKIVTNIRVRVDWKKRDECLAEEVSRVAIEIKKSGNIRVSRNEIGRRLKCLTMIRTKLDKLPLTKEKLKDVTCKE